MSAGEVLRQACLEAIDAIDGMRAYDPAPVQAAFPYAEIDAGAETDWSHKSASGREVRIAVTIRDEGETPARLRALMSEAEARVAAIGSVAGWQLVSLRFARSRIVRERSSARAAAGWAGLVEFRARMLSL